MGRITFLGTGTSQGVPVISCRCAVCLSDDSHDKRLRSSVLVETKGEIIAIDCGPDFRQQMLREDVRRLDAILVTHAHKDHTGGLDDVRAFNYTMRKPMDVYAEANAQKTLTNEFYYAFGENRYPGVPDINLITIDENPFDVGMVHVIPVRGYHLELPVLGYRIGNMAYITDMNRIADTELDKLKGLDILVINSLRKREHLSHFSLPESLEIIKKLAPKRAYLTHISHEMGFYKEVSEIIPENVYLAYDGLKLEFDE
ncbi:MAG: MBL fold metallo-hydrolase [Rikenellaceae bacterium]|nr:MBL fold metallo-hydrolase [Rikenellaceae bacterium]